MSDGPFFGRRVPRNEDGVLLTGQEQFIDDVQPPDVVHVAFWRSDFAHARIRGVDLQRALARPDVIAAYVADDLGELWKPGPLLVSPPPIDGIVFHERCQVPLVKDRILHAGEPVVAVVATSRYAAEDALEDIRVDLGDDPRVAEAAVRRDQKRTVTGAFCPSGRVERSLERCILRAGGGIGTRREELEFGGHEFPRHRGSGWPGVGVSQRCSGA